MLVKYLFFFSRFQHSFEKDNTWGCLSLNEFNFCQKKWRFLSKETFYFKYSYFNKSPTLETEPENFQSCDKNITDNLQKRSSAAFRVEELKLKFVYDKTPQNVTWKVREKGDEGYYVIPCNIMNYIKFIM